MAKKLKAPDIIRLLDPFDHDEWQFSLNEGLITDIYYTDDDGNNSLAQRVKRSWYWLVSPRAGELCKMLGDENIPLVRLQMALFSLKRSPHTPDGTLAGGSIITNWCEDGVYIEIMQPKVGLLVADFLEAEPENEHAKKIAREIERLYYRKDGHRHG